MTTTNAHPSRDLSPDLEAVEAEARRLLDARMKAVRDLAQTRQVVGEREAELRAARDADHAAYDAAATAGWTDEELRKVGLGRLDMTSSKNGSKAGRRTRTTRRRSPRTSTDTATPAATPAAASAANSTPPDQTGETGQSGGSDGA